MIAMTTQNTVNFITLQQNILQFCIAQYNIPDNAVLQGTVQHNFPYGSDYLL
jgi:hypothetical protein